MHLGLEVYMRENILNLKRKRIIKLIWFYGDFKYVKNLKILIQVTNDDKGGPREEQW